MDETARRGPLSPRWLPPGTLLALAGGLAAATRPELGITLVALGILLAVLTLSYAPHRLLAATALAALALAGARGAPMPPAELPLHHESLWRGTVTDDPRPGYDGPRVFTDLEAVAEPGGAWHPTAGRVLLQVAGNPDPPPARGDAIVFRGALRSRQGFRNPGGGRYAAYLERRGVSARARASWPGEVAFATPGLGTPGWLRYRRHLSAAIADAVPAAAGGLLRALVLGDRSALPPELVEQFRLCGTSHLIAISGLHLGLLALFLKPPIRWALGSWPRVALAHPVEPLARVLVLPALVAYGGLAGFQPSTLRALAMTGLVLTASALSRPVGVLPLLSSTALLLGLADPTALADPGLHLSFAALAGLFWLAPALEGRLAKPPSPLDALSPPGPWVRWVRALGRALRRVVCASAGATLATAPLVAYHFGGASLLGFVTNPVGVPLVGFVCLPLGLAGAALHPAWPIAARLLWVLAGKGGAALIGFQKVLAPLATPTQFPSLESVWALAGGCCLVIALALVLITPPRRAAAGLLVAAGLAGLVLPPSAGWIRARLRQEVALWVFDVGQGQALGLGLPGGAWALIDGGGSLDGHFDMGDRVVVPALRAVGCRNLALAISTHPHPDHLGGLIAAVRWGRPAELWLPGGFAEDPRYAPLLAEAAAAGTRPVWVGTVGAEARFGEASLVARWFPATRENDRSLVVWVRCAGRTALLPADLEAAGQRQLLASGESPRCDLLVAPHHGAANALLPPFLAAAAPQVVVASAGGRPGLPAAAFETAVRAAGAAFLSTHRDGCVRVRLGPGPLAVTPGAD